MLYENDERAVVVYTCVRGNLPINQKYKNNAEKIINEIIFT